jgi:AAA+ ATPase superfamily predicted ATPase
MQTYLKEKIGNPALFTGRKKELSALLHWLDGIKTEISKSKVIISRRKTGKSAVMQRLFNILFAQNDQVFPF